MSEKLEWPADRIRKVFLDFFAEKGHRIVASDSLIPQEDPTLLFTGAGMNQFKDYFLGVKKDIKRATSSQKCLRTGDLDNVGRTPYHHSFFEMLGNFSFGDYFKGDAIEWALELLTERFHVSRERLRFSVHRDDDEAFRIWRDRMKVPENRIKKLGDHSNFWPADAPQSGPNGPCGPCSEIFFDQGAGFGCGRSECDVDCDCGRFAEIWNLVFTQFDRQDKGVLMPLAAKNIDTGAGLERIACMLQGKRSNFEIDILQPLVDFVWSQSGKASAEKNAQPLTVARTIADHFRAATFCIADGVIPSNESRGYVVRKLIRRAVWQERKYLSSNRRMEPVLYQLASRVVAMMKEPYPSLQTDLARIEMTIRGEEERFLQTLEEGERILDEIIKTTKRTNKKQISAVDAFRLYDTYGFPDELTVSIAHAHGLEVDLKGFQDLMEEQRVRAKKASKIADTIFVATESNPKLTQLPATVFLGYETLEAEGNVLFLDVSGIEGWAVLDRTPFYAEKGGQVGDRGIWTWNTGEAEILDTQWKEKLIMHRIKIAKGSLHEKEKVKARVDSNLRERTRRHHTATHVLQAALRKVLGTHVRQLGSLVSPEKLRFDFSHPKPLQDNEIKEVENFVNSAILANLDVATQIKSFDESQKEGALAFFGEKYDEKVRILNVGNGLSVELCGGTHVGRTGDMGAFFITSESSIASGTRRIEAVAGFAALEYLRNTRQQLEGVARFLKASPAEILERVEKLQQKVKSMEKGSATKIPAVDVDGMVTGAVQLPGLQAVVQELRDTDVNTLRRLSDQVRNKIKAEAVCVLFSTAGESVSFVVASSSPRVDAGVLTRKIAALMEGSGGGKKDFAQGGSKRIDKVAEARGRIPQLLQEILG